MEMNYRELVMAILTISTIFVLFGLFFFYQASISLAKLKKMIDCTLDFMLRQDKLFKEVMEAAKTRDEGNERQTEE